MNRLFRTLAAAALLGSAVAASVSHGQDTTTVRAAKSYRIYVLPKTTDNNYFTTAFKGSLRANKALGDTVTEVGPTSSSTTTQTQYIDQLIQEHADAIVVSANDPDAIRAALQKAMHRGIKVVGYDSDPTGARNVFVNQADTEQIGRIEVQILGKELNYTGQIAILSATTTATNQNAWIGYMKQELALPKYKNMTLVKIAYGNDDPNKSTTEANGLLTGFPNLRGIISPTTIGILAAAQAVKVAGKTGKVIVTGLGTPNDMRAYVKGGQCPAFALWDPGNLGYLAEYVAHDLLTGTITGKQGDTFSVPGLGKYTIGANNTVLLGPPTVFDKTNIDKFNF
jgi:rhamnose transport system substrate-binding protein